MSNPLKDYLLRRQLRTPRGLPKLAAWYDASDIGSMVYDGSNRVSLIADKSGNSNVNGWVCVGTTDTASAADKTVTGNKVFSATFRLSSTRPSATVRFGRKISGNSGFQFALLSTGVLELSIGDGTSIVDYDSTAAIPSEAFGLHTVTATYTDGPSGSVIFALDGVALGTTVATTKTLANAATAFLVGGSAGMSGVIFRVQVGSVYDFNPTLSAKMAASFSSGGDTWTISTTGATGARICGERDLYQGTVANQPILTIASTGNYMTFDGSNDYLASAPFSLSQPETVCFVGSQVSWTINDVIFDGGSASAMRLSQQGTTPSVSFYAGSSFIDIGAAWVVAMKACVSVLFQSPNGKGNVNRGAQVTGDPGNASASGFTLGARADGAAAGNITASEVAIYAAAHPAGILDRFAKYAIKKWRIAA